MKNILIGIAAGAAAGFALGFFAKDKLKIRRKKSFMSGLYDSRLLKPFEWQPFKDIM